MTLLTHSDKRVPFYFVAFFVFLAAVNAVMVTLAVSTHTGLVTKNPYEKGLNYNRVVAARERQAALGWQGELTYADGVLRFALRDRRGQPITPEKATARFFRPTQEGMDFTVDLQGPETLVTLPAKGLWEVRVEATARGETFHRSRRIVAP